jgi:hypothetical protein
LEATNLLVATEDAEGGHQHAIRGEQGGEGVGITGLDALGFVKWSGEW